MAIASPLSPASLGRPRSVVVFVSCLSAFSLAAFATFYPGEFFPEALLGLLPYGAFTGLLGLGVWNRSKVLWVVNVWTWAALVRRTIMWFMSGAQDASRADLEFNHNLVLLLAAAVLLNVLLSPSLFRWVWRKPEHELR